MVACSEQPIASETAHGRLSICKILSIISLRLNAIENRPVVLKPRIQLSSMSALRDLKCLAGVESYE